MPNPAKNLKSVMAYFGISNTKLARALAVDPSLVSRWLSGERTLKASGAAMDALAEYILAQSRRVHDIEWLKGQFEAAGLSTDNATVHGAKQNLIMWLASDGEALRRNLASSVTQGKPRKETRANPLSGSGGAVKIGCLAIALALKPRFNRLPEGSGLDIFLSHDEIVSAVDEDISRLLLAAIREKRLRVRLLVCVSGNVCAMSRLIDTYMHPLVAGHICLSVVHGMTPTVTRQMHIILPEYAVLVTETPTAAPPVAAIIHEASFAGEMRRSFENSIRYAQPVLHVYGDNFSRNILEILYAEFATPGGLDIIKDNINPLYMTAEAYDRFLRTLHSGAEFTWRSAEFMRFKTGMDGVLRGGTVFREILSLARLNQIARDGYCRMPGLYFMKQGYVKLDARGCAAILEGYIRYLNEAPCFHVLILDDINLLQSDNCIQIKQNHHVAINHWSGSEPVMVHSDQLLLIREFQAHFDALWAQGAGSLGNRSAVIATLQDVLRRLKEQHLPQKEQ